MEKPRSSSSVIRKCIVAVILGVLVWFVSGTLGFPHVFQVMFVIYVGLGLLVFLLLDAPPVQRMSGFASALALIGFYALLSSVYVLGASALPQYNPEVEKGKIEKILKPRRARMLAKQGHVEELLKKVTSLKGESDVLLARLNTFAPASAAFVPSEGLEGEPMTVVERGAEVYDLYECYNCHKIGGKGSVKKRGPILDNIGNLLTAGDIKRKIFDPTYLYAEGFEKEHKKGKMPDKYKDLMTDEEVDALATYLSTLKDPSVETPKPVFVRSDVQHGFTVYGIVRGKNGKPAPNIEVHVMPKKKHGHGASGKTNDSGYYEVFVHMHNEDVGTTVEVSAKDVKKEFVANYDPNDKVNRRQKSIDFVIPLGS